MVDILLSAKPDYFSKVREGEWYQESFSLNKSFSLNVVLETTKVGPLYVVIKTENFCFVDSCEKVTYVYVLRQNKCGLMSEFKVYVNSTNSETIKKVVIDKIAHLDRIIHARTCSSNFHRVTTKGTSVYRQDAPASIVLTA
jgi:hypothetical protein